MEGCRTQVLTPKVATVSSQTTDSRTGKAVCLWVSANVRPVPHAAGLFPISGADFEALNAAVERLTLNDASVSVKRENSAALGAGFRCG